MKTNKLFLAAIASAMFVGCADEELVSVENGSVQNLNGKLVDAGLLSVGRGETTESRAYNPYGNFVWMPSELETNGSLTANRQNQRVGFCWTGRNTVESSFGATNTVGANVFTNYEYEHVGWLDVAATSPKIKDCTDDELVNGAYIVGEGQPEASYTNNWNTSGRWNAYYKSAKLGSYTANNHSESTGELQLNRGIFSTKNASVFEGEYLVYYPYTDAFTKGEIVAELPTTYTVDTSKDAFAAASDSAFAVGYVNHYEGGNSSSGLSAKTLNGFAVVRLYNYASTIAPADVNISKVIIYSKSGQILYHQSLDASKCVSALAPGGSGLGTNVYGSESKKTNTIVANLTDGTNKYTEIEGKTTEPQEATKYNDYVYVALPILPQAITENFEVVLVNDEDQTCRIDEAPVTFTSNGAVYFDYNLADYTFKNEYMVTDEASLWSAWNKIYTSGSTIDVNKILVMNDIRLEQLGVISGNAEYTSNNSNIHNAWFYNKDVEITTECAVKPVLTLASEQLMSIKSKCKFTTTYEPTLTFDVPVVVEGAGCCEKQPAALVIGGVSDKDYNIVFNEKVTNHGTLAVANNHQDNGQTRIVSFNELENSYDASAVNRNKTAGAAQLYLLGNGTEINIKELNNSGNVQSVPASIELDKLFGVNAYSSPAWPAELNTLPTGLTTRVVETTIGTLNNTSTEGVTSGLIEIEENTLINVTAELTNADENAVIKIKGTSVSATDGRLDVMGTSANEGTIDNTGVVNFNTASLDNNGLFIDRQNGQVGGYKVDNGEGAVEGTTTKTYGNLTYKTDLGYEGIYVAQVETEDRMSVVLGDAVVEPSTVIVEIMGCDDNFYNLEEFKKTLYTKDVIINANKQIVIKSYKTENGVNVPTLTSFGHCVTVLSNNTLIVTEGYLKTRSEVNVEADAIFKVRAGVSVNSNMNVTVEIGTNLNNAGKTINTANLLTVKGDLNNYENATFDSDKSFTVKGNVATSGTFDSDGTPNIVEGNFTQNDGDVTFATQTTTTINGTFTSVGGTFEREGLNGTNAYRATVNVGELGSLQGSSVSGWPTRM